MLPDPQLPKNGQDTDGRRKEDAIEEKHRQIIQKECDSMTSLSVLGGGCMWLKHKKKGYFAQLKG